jgi:hypothetical protein
MKMNQNYAYYLNANLAEYAGKWVVILNDKVLASGDRVYDIKKKVEEIKKSFPDATPLVTRIQEDKPLIL